ncbi:MAG: trehalose-phosphatase [Candidatus Binataceae bacterium]
MPGNLPKASRFERIPAPLPKRLITSLLDGGQILLCLDYDGTIAEISSDPAQAWPFPGVGETLQALAGARERVLVAIVSGRDLATMKRLLGAASAGLILVGTHGLELSYDGTTRELAHGVAECEPELVQFRAWLAANLPRGMGFVIEDKGIAIALHYRNAPVAVGEAVRHGFEDFLSQQTPRLAVRHGKMVVEAIPSIAGKGHVVLELMRRAGPSFTPVYFGDDLTDEDAFAAIDGRGITVLVGDASKSGARYRVDSPCVVAGLLREMAAALGATPRAAVSVVKPR